MVGTSPGKAALGLRVVHLGTVRRSGCGRALLRTLILGVAALPTFGLGVATLAWTAVMDPGRQRRGWHDPVTDAVVVDVRPVPVRGGRPRRRGRSSTSPRCGWSRRHRRRRSPTRPSRPTRRRPPSLRPDAPPAAPARPPGPPARCPPRAGRPTVVRSGAAHRPAPTARWRVSFDTGETFVVEGLALVGRRPEGRGRASRSATWCRSLGGHVAVQDPRPVPGRARRRAGGDGPRVDQRLGAGPRRASPESCRGQADHPAARRPGRGSATGRMTVARES